MAEASGSTKTLFSSISNPPIITTVKLQGSDNYASWAASVELWFMGQGYIDHLENNVTGGDEKNKTAWIRIDAQLCSLLWHSLEPKLLNLFQSCKTCYKVWTKAKALYTNDIQRIYKVVSNLVHLQQSSQDMSSYLGQVETLKDEFNSLMPFAEKITEQEQQRDKFFMVLALIGLKPDLSSVRDQILTSPTIPSLEDVSARLLRISSHTAPSGEIESSVLAVQTRHGDPQKGKEKGSRGHCTHCNKHGHTRENCWALHGKPPRNNQFRYNRPAAHVVQTQGDGLLPLPDASNQQSNSITLTGADYNEYLQYQAIKQNGSSKAGKSFACLTKSPPLGPWIIDSGASDHISGNKNHFTTFTPTSNSSNVTLANGSQTAIKGIGNVQLPSISLDHVLFAPACPYNLVSVSKLTKSLDCSITFVADSVIVQDRSTGKMIGTGHESQGLYHLFNPNSSVAFTSTTSADLLHHRFGHPSLNKLQKLTPSLSTLSSLECESCQLGKQIRNSFPKRVNNRATCPFELVHSDIWGPSQVSTTMGFHYFVIFIDDYSRCTWVYLMKNRSELFSIFQKFHAEIQNQFSTSIKVLRSDNGREYLSTSFSNFLSSKGITHQTSCAYTPQQNGVAERKNRHLIETTRTLLIHHNVPLHFWGDALLTACYLINRMPSSVLQGQSPYSILFQGEDPYHLPLRVFGCTCFVHDHTPGKDKLKPKSIKCVFLGYSRLQKGYKCYDPTTKKYHISADVTFFESSPYFSSSIENTQSISNVLPIPRLPFPQTDLTTQNPPLRVYSRKHYLPTNVTDPSSDTGAVPNSSDFPAPSSPAPVMPVAEAETPPIAIRKGNRSTRNPYPIYNFLSHHRLSPSYNAFVSTLSNVTIPKTVSEALQHPGWRDAMMEEMKALHSNGTWELVLLPKGKTTVGCKWVFTVKVGPDGQIDRLKARLVAKGYTQVYGIDYNDTFSPVAKITTVRLLISMAAMHHWTLHQLDIKNAFLHGELTEEVYMEQPPGFVAQGESRLVCRLRRSLYGLKQSPRAWFGRFSSVIQEFGMTRCQSDHSVFFRHNTHGKCIYLVVYVDDIVITGNDHDGICQLKKHLCCHFQTKDLGKLKYFLGIEVAQSKIGIVISQRKYVLDLLEETSMLDCKPMDTPMDPNVKLVPGQGEPLKDPERYRRLVGRLNYLTLTRPDISFAVSVVSQFLQAPCNDHWDAVIRILKYLKRAPAQGLLYEDRGHHQIIGYSDADWAGSPSDRRSTSGYCILIGGNLISWKSKKQEVVARSSAEAEYRAMALATCELIWLKQLLQELRWKEIKSMKLICDNQAALHIASNPVFHERTKHIEVDCHFVRQKVESGCIVTDFVNSNAQLADMFTKSLRGPRIKYICGKLGAYDLYAPA